MPKVQEDKHASNAFNFIITLSPNNNDYSLKHFSPTKCSLIRPLFWFLLFAVVLMITTIISRTTVQLQDRSAITELNPTLLKYAAIDINEEPLKQEIRQLLDPKLGDQARVPITLHSPLFHRYLPNFQKVLNEWFHKKRFDASVLSELTHLLKHQIDNHNNHNGMVSSESSERRYSSCAIVGNSGILLNKDYGKLIDSHEVVIRLNNARVETFENKVGSKTNISFVNSNILHTCARIVGSGCTCHSYGADVATIMYICQPSHFMDFIMCSSYNLKAPLLVTDPRFDLLCARIVKYYSLKRFLDETGKGLEEWGPAHDEMMFHYSSGFQALMLGLGICDKVSMFGFGKSSMAKHHYHTNQMGELRLHDYEAEYAFYRDLVDGHRKIPFLLEKFKIPPVVMYQ